MRQYSLEVRNIESQRKGDEASSCQVRSRRRVANKSRRIPLHLVYAQSSRVINVLHLQFRRSRSKASRRRRSYPTPSFASNFHVVALQPLFQEYYSPSNASRIQILSQCPSSLYASFLVLGHEKITVDNSAQAALSLAASFHIIYKHRPLSDTLDRTAGGIPRISGGVFLPNEQQPTVWHR